MERFEIGMLAKSKAGHDKGQCICSGRHGRFICIFGGRLRIKTMENPKKKKI